MKFWMAQGDEHKGTAAGFAHTIAGEHTAPWDPGARWKELADGKYCDAPDVRVTAYSSTEEMDAAIRQASHARTLRCMLSAAIEHTRDNVNTGRNDMLTLDVITSPLTEPCPLILSLCFSPCT